MRVRVWLDIDVFDAARLLAAAALVGVKTGGILPEEVGELLGTPEAPDVAACVLELIPQSFSEVGCELIAAGWENV